MIRQPMSTSAFIVMRFISDTSRRIIKSQFIYLLLIQIWFLLSHTIKTVYFYHLARKV